MPAVQNELWRPRGAAHAARARRGLHASDHGSRRDALHARAARRARCARSRRTARLAARARRRRYPAPRPKRERAQRHVAVLVVDDPEGRVLLERRPARGIWGGLYSLPELGADDIAARVVRPRARRARRRPSTSLRRSSMRSRTSISISTPRLLELAATPAVVNDRDDVLACAGPELGRRSGAGRRAVRRCDGSARARAHPSERRLDVYSARLRLSVTAVIAHPRGSMMATE